MIEKNRAMPRAPVIPELAYADVDAAADWLCDAFGFTLRFRFGGHRAQLNIGDGGAMVVMEGGGASAAPDHGVMVRVADVDGHCARAKLRGAAVLSEPQDYPYGERQYSVADIGGHRWVFSQSIADFDPAAFGAVIGTLS